MRFRSHYCPRRDDARLASLAWRHGIHATLAQLVALLRGPCPWRTENPEHRPRKCRMKCGAFCLDIGPTSPPDWPPLLMGLTLIEGEKDEQLLTSPGRDPARRCVGGSDRSHNAAISPLPAEQVAVAAAAAWPVFDAAGVTPDAAAQADFERDVWDLDGFPEPGPTEVLKNADVWSEAEAAACRALMVRWPRLRTAWISLRLDGPAATA